VILDVVYNHFGPVGNYTNKFGPYLTDSYNTPWGAAVNFDDAGSDEVRRFFCDNAEMWLRDYHVDGLRLDAVHAIRRPLRGHFLEQLSAEVERLGTTLGRKLVLIAESDLNDPRLVRPREANGYGMTRSGAMTCTTRCLPCSTSRRSGGLKPGRGPTSATTRTSAPWTTW
jgi:maltooligosyltrehalose trehalohydrolase